VCWATERGFDSETHAPGAARQFIGSTLLELVPTSAETEVLADAELVISELVSNAVQAGAAKVRVGLELHHGQLELDVADDGPGWPTLVRPGAHEAHGRGLVLVNALAQRWAAEPIEAGGKRVRVILVVPPEFTRALECNRPRANLADQDR
jgi:anti-sigma regulatory factor (Ser/Thr protein kinase)